MLNADKGKREKVKRKAALKSVEKTKKGKKRKVSSREKGKRISFLECPADVESRASAGDNQTSGFDEFGLDERLLKGIAGQSWVRPTLVQQEMIPLVLDGKDVIARARTGTGKTAAFLIPLVQKILEKQSSGSQQNISALLLAPTKELSKQICDHGAALTERLSQQVRFVDLAAVSEKNSRIALLSSRPDVVVSTPSGILDHISDANASPTDVNVAESLDFLVLDEADLLLSFGYEAEMKEISRVLAQRGRPQTILTSATLSDHVKTLKSMVTRNAVTLKLKEAQLPSASQLAQFQIKCQEEEKFVLIYALLKLRLLQGKTIIFVKDTDSCYRLRLFLEQFGIFCCVLNAEMPSNSRSHIVLQFNEGLYDYIIAADDDGLLDCGSAQPPAEQTAGQLSGKRRRKKKAKAEYGVSRGVDFNRVSNVVNFDFPTTVDAYIHRVGRTARGFNRGTALSFAVDGDAEVLEEVQQLLSEQMGDEALKPYQFRMEELDGFRYRARDVLSSVTSYAIREARLAEIRRELIKSDKLNSYFARNPNERALIRHDHAFKTLKHGDHLKDVPDYIVPPVLRGTNYSSPFGVRKRCHKASVKRTLAQKRRRDPLASFDDAD